VPQFPATATGFSHQALGGLIGSLQARISGRLGLPEVFFEQTRPKRIPGTEFPAGCQIIRANVCWRRLPPQPNADEEREYTGGYLA